MKTLHKNRILMGGLLAVMLSTLAMPSMADRDDRGGRDWDKRWHKSWDKHRDRGRDKHWEKRWERDRHPGYRHKSWKPQRREIHVYRQYRPDYSGYLGAALIGSAITYSLSHSHDGVRCHNEHDYRDRHFRDRRYEVTGCHRVERFADGSERRVSVPLSQCY